MSSRIGIGAVAVCLGGVVAAGCSGGSSKSYVGAATAATTSGSTTGGGFGGTTGTGGGTTTIQPGGSGSGLHPPGSWVKGDLHGHSAPYSQDADRQGGDPPGTCFALAEINGLDFYALTDHRTMAQINDPTYNAQNVTILSGEEWGGTIHIGMVGLNQQVPELDMSLGASTINAQIQQAYDDCHSQGGAVITNHPCQDSKMHVYLSHDFDAVEVWNAYWNFPKGYKDSDQSDIDDKLNGLGLTQIGEDANPEIKAAVTARGGGASNQALKFWEENLNMGRHKAIVGGGDRHSITFPGIPKTYVWAESNTEDKIIEGIRAGRTWVGAADGPEVDYTADADGDGVFERIIGDSVPLNQLVTYKVRVQNALDGRVDIIRNGQTVYQFAVLSNDETFTWTDTATAQTWTRVDVFEKADFNLQGGQGFQLLALGGALSGQTGMQSLLTVATPYNFQVSVGTRYPTIRLSHDIDKILNFDRVNWGYSRGAITSPIWAE